MNIFMSSTATTNEEYALVLRKRMHLLCCLFALGVAINLVVFGLAYFKVIPADSHTTGYFSGIGGGLIMAGIFCWLRLHHIINSEDALKKARLNETDERLQQIKQTALKTAGVCLFAITYFVAIFGGILFPQHFEALQGLILVQITGFVLFYAVFFFIYQRKL